MVPARKDQALFSTYCARLGRGEDLFAATHVHRLLQVVLGLPACCTHHLLLFNAKSKRFAKRDRA